MNDHIRKFSTDHNFFLKKQLMIRKYEIFIIRTKYSFVKNKNQLRVPNNMNSKKNLRFSHVFKVVALVVD